MLSDLGTCQNLLSLAMKSVGNLDLYPLSTEGPLTIFYKLRRDLISMKNRAPAYRSKTDKEWRIEKGFEASNCTITGS